MANNLFVAGIPYETTQDELAKLFSSCGTVVSVKLIMDRETARPKGFGFVEMSTEAEAKAVIAKFNGYTLAGRKLLINEARPQEPRPPRAGGFPPKPGFVERRSGKDRRRSGSAPTSERRDFGEKKPWAEKKKWGKKKPWAEKKDWGDKKPFGEKKPWIDKKKPWEGMKKKWDDKPGEGGPKPKSFERKKPKWGPGGPDAGKKFVPKRRKFGSGIFGGKSHRPGA